MRPVFGLLGEPARNSTLEFGLYRKLNKVHMLNDDFLAKRIVIHRIGNQQLYQLQKLPEM